MKPKSLTKQLVYLQIWSAFAKYRLNNYTFYQKLHWTDFFFLINMRRKTFNRFNMFITEDHPPAFKIELPPKSDHSKPYINCPITGNQYSFFNMHIHNGRSDNERIGSENSLNGYFWPMEVTRIFCWCRLCYETGTTFQCKYAMGQFIDK